VVQRGDAEMAQKLWRVVRACVELGPANPIQQIHDQGAGGNCNVVKEIIYPLGAEVNVRNVRSLHLVHRIALQLVHNRGMFGLLFQR
jgi:phosphoribosylformylglycinamidine (FGAM) synthase-like enzyme